MTAEERETYRLKAVLRMFETLGALCVNTYDAMERAGDKLYSLQLAKRAVPEVRIPRTMLLTDATDLEDAVARIGFPMVMKVMHGYQGRRVCLIEDARELSNIVGMMATAPYGDQVILQEAITSSKGRDLRVVVAAGEVVTSFVRRNDGEFKSNLHQGGGIERYDPPEELKEQSVRIAEAFGLRMVSVDYLFGDDGGFYLCEVNSIPGISYLFKAQEEGDTELVERFMSMPHQDPAQRGRPLTCGGGPDS